MENKEKVINWLLTDVPADIEKLITEQQKKKKEDCGCKYGRSQAIYSLLRKAYIKTV